MNLKVNKHIYFHERVLSKCVELYKEKDGVNRFLSEDYYFCRLAEECGFEIWTDLQTPITHLGSTEYHGSFISQLNKK